MQNLLRTLVRRELVVSRVDDLAARIANLEARLMETTNTIARQRLLKRLYVLRGFAS